MKINTRKPSHWFLLAQQGLFTLIAIVNRNLSRKQPTPMVVLYGHQLSGNLKALYDFWSRSQDQSFEMAFLSLDPEQAAALEASGINVLRCDSLTDMLVVGSARAIITDHGLHAMTPLLKWTDIFFIDVWHGIPFKGFVAEDFKLQHQYDEVWVSSPLLKQIYSERFGFEPERVISMGYARTDKLFQPDDSGLHFRQTMGITEQEKVVLYAPTWQQDHSGRDLFPFGESAESFINELVGVCKKNGARLVIRSHLNAEIDTDITDRAIFCSQKEYADTEAILLATDVLVCDWSSIAFDFLPLQRPTLFLDVPAPFRNGFTLGPEYRFGFICPDLHKLGEAISSALSDGEQFLAPYQNFMQTTITDAYGDHTSGTSSKEQFGRLEKLFTHRA
tara:strand:+ start:27493 stop:28662 length:1170 start_codon:yes stop_codon:yes gene_type:complete